MPVYNLFGIGNFYIGLIALTVNIVIAAALTAVLGQTPASADKTVDADYEDAPGTV